MVYFASDGHPMCHAWAEEESQQEKYQPGSGNGIEIEVATDVFGGVKMCGLVMNLEVD